MKIGFAILLFSLIVFKLNAQINFYTPDGKEAKPLPGNNTVGQITHQYEPSDLTHVYVVKGYKDDGIAQVTFKLFTNKPILISTEHPERIKKYVSQFSLSKYFNSWEFEFDLDTYIKKKNLTDIYVIQTLGKPARKTRAADANNVVEVFEYTDKNLMITFTNGIATEYAVQRS